MKKFKHLLAALAIVLAALSVNACEEGIDDFHDEVFVYMELSSPSYKKLHVEYDINAYVRTIYGEGNQVEKHEYRVMDNSEIDRVIVFGLGLDNKNYHFQETIYGQSTGSVDFELDKDTYGVEVTVRVVLKNKTLVTERTVFSEHEKYWFQEQL